MVSACNAPAWFEPEFRTTKSILRLALGATSYKHKTVKFVTPREKDKMSQNKKVYYILEGKVRHLKNPLIGIRLALRWSYE